MPQFLFYSQMCDSGNVSFIINNIYKVTIACFLPRRFLYVVVGEVDSPVIDDIYIELDYCYTIIRHFFVILQANNEYIKKW